MKAMDWKQKVTYASLLIIGIVFFFFVGIRGHIIGGDSEVYIAFRHQIPFLPFYPLFLQVCRKLFGEAYYLDVVAAMQGMVSLAACLSIVRFFQKKFLLKNLELFLLFLLSLMPFAIEFPRYIISHEIMTEGFGYPMFYFYIMILLTGIYKRKSTWVIGSALFVVFMGMLRAQLQFLFAVSAIVYFYVTIMNRAEGKKESQNAFLYYASSIIVCFLMIFGGMKLVTIADDITEKKFFGIGAQSYTSFTMFSKVIFASDEDDIDLFQDEELRELFSRIYYESDRQKCRYVYTPEGIWGWEYIQSGTAQNTRVEMEVTAAWLREVKGMSDEYAIEQESLRLCGEMMKVLFWDNLGGYLSQSFRMMIGAFVATVLFKRQGFYMLCHIGTAIFYLLAFILIGIFYKFDKLDSRKAETMLLIAGTAIMNVVATDLMFVTVQRYLIYTYGLLYIAMYLLLKDLYIGYIAERHSGIRLRK